MPDTSSLEEILNHFNGLPEKERQAVAKEVVAATAGKIPPNPGPQTEAYLSQADILLYGGQAGGGKTALEVLLAAQEHEHSIIFRREASQTDGLEKFGKEVMGSDCYNGSEKLWDLPDGRSVKLAGMKETDDWMKHAGRERDLVEFDEAGEFEEIQVASILAWNRGREGQRCRAVLGSNPPRSAEGEWLLKWFAPWLDKSFPDPAEPGELRFAVYIADEKGSVIHWVEGLGEYEFEGETYTAKSYTFIPAALADNPYRNTKEYRATLQNLPEPLRSQLLYGDFLKGRKDADMQLIPTAWIDAAMERWTPRPPEGMAMTAMALDPAGGGKDNAEIARRYGGWYDELISESGAETADGSATAATVVKHRRDACPVIVDVGGGYGGAVCLRLKDNDITHSGFNGASSPTVGATTKDGKLTFANKRSENYWKFREALDPDQEGGSIIALPPNQELRGDLAAPRWKLTTRGIQVESKVEYDKNGKVSGGIKKRLGRSPGKGDAVAMCLSEGTAAVMRERYSGGNRPQVLHGHMNRKRR